MAEVVKHLKNHPLCWASYAFPCLRPVFYGQLLGVHLSVAKQTIGLIMLCTLIIELKYA